jgi:hypothetical protein
MLSWLIRRDRTRTLVTPDVTPVTEMPRHTPSAPETPARGRSEGSRRPLALRRAQNRKRNRGARRARRQNR